MASDKDFLEVLRVLGADKSLLTAEQRLSLERMGYVMAPNLVDDRWVKELREAFDKRLEVEGERAGSEFEREEGTARLANCVNKGEVFRRAALFPWVLSVAHHVIGRPFKLHGYNARDALPGQGRQELHSDDAEAGNKVNAIWLLDDFEVDNGATRLVPGSHRKTNPVQEELKDPKAPHPNEVIVQAPRGTVLVIDSHLWHGGTRNVSGRRRRVLHISYVSRESPQQVDQRANITKDAYAQLTRAQKYLLDVDGAHPEVDTGGTPDPGNPGPRQVETGRQG